MIFNGAKRATSLASIFTLLVASLGLAVLPGMFSAPANAATTAFFEQIKDVSLTGIVIQYRPGVSPIAPNGEVTGANFAGIALRSGHGIGQNMFTATFVGEPTKQQIAESMANLARSPQVAMVAPDQKLHFAAFRAPFLAQGSGAAQTLLAAGQPAAAVVKVPARSASAVRGLKVADGFSALKPNLAQLALSWAAPSNLYHGALVGYEIQQSLDAGKTFRVLVANTRSTARKYVVTKNVAAGLASTYKLRAITKFGSTTKLGIFSASVAGTPTSAPQAPVLVGSDAVVASTSPTWLPQNLSQRGGLAVTYQATASSPGAPDVTCAPADPTAYNCVFVGLDPNRKYTAKIRATNLRGATVSLPNTTVTDPMFNEQWYLTGQFGINAQNAWSQSKGNYISGKTTKRVTVAVIDTGYTFHPDLDSQYVRDENGQIAGYDFVSDANSANDGNGWDPNAEDNGDHSGNNPSSWHATHVSGLIAAAANNGVGITGVAPGAQILPVRALGSLGGTSSDLAAAINWAIGLPIPNSLLQNQVGVTPPPINSNPAQVVNISMGTSGFTPCDAATQAAVTAAVKRNVTIVTAAGNDLGLASASYPGNCLGTINVGATSAVGDRAMYSNYGSAVDVSAPGGDSTQTAGTTPEASGEILSDLNAGTQESTTPSYGYDEGTSMAAPLVAGTAALMYAVHPTITFDQAAQIIIDTASKFNADSSLTFNADRQTNALLASLGHCSTQVLNSDNTRPRGWCGSGIVNTAAAVAAAAALP